MGDLAMGRSNRKPAQSSLALLGQLLQSALPFEVFFFRSLSLFLVFAMLFSHLW